MAEMGPRQPARPERLAIEVQSPEEQLIEVARAEALLNQRDPDQAARVVRAQFTHQGTEGERRQRAAVVDSAVRKGARARRKRRLRVAVTAAVVIAAAIPLGRLLLQENDRAGVIEVGLGTLAKPAAQLGFREQKSWLDVPAAGISFAMPADTCATLVAVREGASEALPLEIDRENATRISAPGGVMWCGCEAEKVTVTIPGAGTGGPRHALRWMSAAVGTVGGVDVLTTQSTAPYRLVVDAAARACADAGFRTWAELRGHGDVGALEARRAGVATELAADGFEGAGLLTPEQRFGVVRAEKGRCYLAAPEAGPSEVTLRAPDGARLVGGAKGAVAWCAHAADGVFSLWRAEKATAPVVLMSAPADRVGGVTGVRAAARRHGLREVQVALLPEDLAKDARASLAAATVAPTSIDESDPTGLPGKSEHSVVAFALREKVAMLPEVRPVVPTGCQPELEATAPLRTFLCAETRAQVWHPGGDARQQGAAEGPLPYWLGIFGGATDEGALRAAATLMLFAQRMTLLGYEPTTSDGVKDSPEGGVLSGWVGKGDVVAVGISRAKPWMVPLTDGPAWTLEGPLRVLQIAVGATKTVRGAARLAADPKDRRVVAWRR
jgi:hypothetical protein